MLLSELPEISFTVNYEEGPDNVLSSKNYCTRYVPDDSKFTAHGKDFTDRKGGNRWTYIL